MNRRYPALLGLAAIAALLSGCDGSGTKLSEKRSQIRKTRTVAARHAGTNASGKSGESLKKPAPEPAWVKDIRLQGIGGQPARRLAIINGKTLGAGDGIQVKTSAKTTVILRCMKVNQSSAVVTIEGVEGERELRLN